MTLMLLPDQQLCQIRGGTSVQVVLDQGWCQINSTTLGYTYHGTEPIKWEIENNDLTSGIPDQ